MRIYAGRRSDLLREHRKCFQKGACQPHLVAPCVLASANVVKHRTSDCKPSLGSPPGRYLFGSRVRQPSYRQILSFRRNALILIDCPPAEETNQSRSHHLFSADILLICPSTTDIIGFLCPQNRRKAAGLLQFLTLTSVV